MSYSVDDKVNYNRQKKTPFSYGYVWGVQSYRNYGRSSQAGRKAIKKEIDSYRKQSAGDSKLKSTQCAKGYMCAIRDCANEHKKKK